MESQKPLFLKFHKVFLFIFVISLLFSNVFAKEGLRDKLEELFNKNEFRKAFNLVITQDLRKLKDSDLMGLCSYILTRYHRFNKAKKLSELALEIEPSEAYALLTKAYLKFLNGNLKGSIKILKKLETEKPDFKELYYLMVDIYNHSGDYAKSLNALEKLLKFKSTNIRDEIYKRIGPSLIKFLKNHLLTDFFAVYATGEKVQLPIKIETDRIIIKGSYGKSILNLILDSGGSYFISLDSSYLPFIKDYPVNDIEILGINGFIKAKVGMLDNLTFTEKCKILNLPAIFFDFSQLNINSGEKIDGIIGISWLKKFTTEFELVNNRIILKSSEQEFNKNWKSFYLLGDDKIIIRVLINGKEALGLIDTGASQSILSLDFALNELGFSRESFERISLYGIGNGKSEAFFCNEDININVFNNIFNFQSMIVSDLLEKYIANIVNLNIELVIGIDIIRKFKKISFDFPERRILMVR